MYARANKSN